MERFRRTQTLVVGSGLAGLYAALQAGERGDVLVVTNGTLEDSSSYWAQGGVAAAMADDDAAELHEDDTLRVGRGLCREAAVELLTVEAPRHVECLQRLGVDFAAVDGALTLGLEAGHSRRRIAHAGGGSTGRVIVEVLVQRVLEHERIEVFDNTPVTGLISDGERCYGAFAGERAIEAAATILATGGAASLYARTTNPPGARGQGIAHAWRAGACIADMEFIQFHPTALALTGDGDGFLLSEALRGEGAHLLDATGERFMPAHHPEAELAPRDELARAIVRQMRVTGSECVYLSLAHLDRRHLQSRFAQLAQQVEALGLDLFGDRLPVAPAAHYVMGGVLTGLHGETTLPGLLACGEVACTGVHGANRLASNSLLECLVFAGRAAEWSEQVHPAPDDLLTPAPTRRREQPLDALRQSLWAGAGISRSNETLQDTAAAIMDGGADELSDEALVASLIVSAARIRQESRGAHFRSDYPNESGDWLRHIVLARDSEPELTVL